MSVIRCLPIFILSTHSLKWETRKPSKAPSHKPKRFHIDVAFLTSELIKRYTRPFVGSIWERVAKGFQMSTINEVDVWISISVYVRNWDQCKKWYTFQGPSPPNTLLMRFHVRNWDQCKKYICFVGICVFGMVFGATLTLGFSDMFNEILKQVCLFFLKS